MTMRIIQIITVSEPIGGAQMVLFNNTKAMVDQGLDVQVVVGNKGSLTQRLEKLNVHITCLPNLKRKISLVDDIKCYRALCDLFKENNPDIVISHSSKAGILSRLACYKTGVKNIFTVHGWSFTPGVRGMKRYFYLAVEKIMGKFTDYLIAVSQFDRELALAYKIVPNSKIRVIYNGSPDFLVENTPKESTAISILMTARFSDQKDHMTLFKALEILRNEPIQVDLVGSGQSISKFIDLSKDMEIDHLIKFHGESNDIPSFLNKADIFVLTSMFEGLPLSICEAMSVGVPILATNVGGVSEMVTDGYNGYLIPVEDYKYLAKKLLDLVQDNKMLKSLGENSRKTFHDKFSLKQMSIATQEYVNEIVHHSHDQ